MHSVQLDKCIALIKLHFIIVFLSFLSLPLPATKVAVTLKILTRTKNTLGIECIQKQTVYDTNPNAPAPTGWENFAYEILV